MGMPMIADLKKLLWDPAAARSVPKLRGKNVGVPGSFWGSVQATSHVSSMEGIQREHVGGPEQSSKECWRHRVQTSTPCRHSCAFSMPFLVYLQWRIQKRVLLWSRHPSCTVCWPAVKQLQFITIIFDNQQSKLLKKK